MKQEKVFLIIGSPGAGKGTQANLLSERFGFYHFRSSRIVGRIIEKAEPGSFIEIEGKKYYFEKQKQLRESGKLWDPAFLTYFVQEKIRQLHKEGEGIVFDGAIRTMYEGERVIPLLKQLYGADNIKVIYLEITEDEVIFRNTHRRECELIRHSVLYSQETVKLTKCQLDGSKLVKRKDDNPEVIKVRLKEFQDRTVPLLKLFEKQGLIVDKINGSLSPADVFHAILKKYKDDSNKV